MAYEIVFLKEARKEFDRLDGSIRPAVAKALLKVASNPLPNDEGGYGKPLGKRGDTNLAGMLKIKLRGPGIRVVYKLERIDEIMRIVVVGMRSDNEVYRDAQRRKEKYDL